MERVDRSASILIASLCLAAMLAACAAHAPDFGGRWRPVNVFAETPREIPLQRAQVFAASPVDGTLRNLLQRWAQEAHLRLDYAHPSDFTLHRAAADVRASDLREALARLSQAYAGQRVVASLEEGRIVVRAGAAQPTSDGPPATTAASAAP